jgi:hypothetical protein
VPLGTSVYDSASVGPGVAGFPIGGTVHYFFGNGSSCGTAISGITIYLGGPSMTVGPLTAGNYWFIAIYNGDSNYLGSTSPCEAFTILNASTTTATQIIVEPTQSEHQ